MDRSARALSSPPHEPSRSCVHYIFRIRLRIARPCPGDEPVRTHEQRAQPEAILGVARDVPDSLAPHPVERLQRRAPAEIQ